MTAGAEGWRKVKGAAQYCGLSERTMRDLLKQGLPHSRLPSGTVLISLRRLDEYLGGFEVRQNEIDQVVDDVCAELERSEGVTGG